MSELNFARFTVEGTPSEDPTSGNRGYDATAAQNLDVTLEAAPAVGITSVTYSVFDAADPESPFASKDCPTLSWTEGGDQTVTPTNLNYAVHLVAPAAINSVSIRCVATLATGSGFHLFERLVVVRGSGTTPTLRKTVPAESQQYSQRSWSDSLNEIVDAINTITVGGSTAWGNLEVTLAQLTANQNNWAPTGLTAA